MQNAWRMHVRTLKGKQSINIEFFWNRIFTQIEEKYVHFNITYPLYNSDLWKNQFSCHISVFFLRSYFKEGFRQIYKNSGYKKNKKTFAMKIAIADMKPLTQLPIPNVKARAAADNKFSSALI